MKILVTGAGGLIGSHLLPLLEKDHTLFTISSKLINSVNNFNIDFTKEWTTDILPRDLDVIIHLAQNENFRDFPNMAKDIFYTNTLSTLKLIDFAKQNKVTHFIYASSAGIYGNSDDAFSEQEDIIYKKALGFYLATKHCSEVILDNYVDLLNVIQLRLFFVYGNGQRKDMLMARLVNNVKNGQPVLLSGESGLKMNPIHATDAANAIASALNLNQSEIINIGGSEVLSLKEIGKTIGRLVNVEPIFSKNLSQKPNHLIGDISKMKNLLFEPIIKFEEGIKTIL